MFKVRRMGKFERSRWVSPADGLSVTQTHTQNKPANSQASGSLIKHESCRSGERTADRATDDGAPCR